jgi:integrase
MSGNRKQLETSGHAESKASGLPKISFHALRHSYASISLRAGTPLKVVSEMLGHTTTAITADLYTQVLSDLKAQAADRLDKIFESAKKRRVVGAESGVWANRATDFEKSR